tara:strand:+ start:550 stop:810 length:261 start_codon:yes stop_codon:yes gene_type:complete
MKKEKGENKMSKLSKEQVDIKIEEIMKKVFLTNQHKVMESIAEEMGVQKELLYYAFANNKTVRKELTEVLKRHQDYFMKGAKHECN